MTTLTKKQVEVLATNKQYILIKGERKSGKTFIGCCAVLSTVIKENNKYAYIIIPTIKFAEDILNCILYILSDSAPAKSDVLFIIDSINRRDFTIKFRNGSVIQILLYTKVFEYEFRGYHKPDVIFIDNAEFFNKQESKRLFRILRDNYFTRAFNCKFIIIYYQLRLVDRLQALWRIAGFNKNWFRITIY